MATKRVGLGTVLAVDIAGTTTAYVTVASVRSISRSGGAGTVIDVSTVDDTGYFMQKRGGRIEPGQVTLELMYDPADTSQKSLNAIYESRAVAQWKLTFGSTSLFETWQGFVNAVGVEHPFDGAVTSSVTIEVTDDPGFST